MPQAKVDDIPQKPLDDYFSDWEGDVFGFGYGSGEPHIIPVLRRFFELTPEGEAYDFQKLEADLGGPITWLLINILAKHSVDILEYGTSPRYAWLLPKGKSLRKYMLSKTTEELIALSCRSDDEPGPGYVYSSCSRNACNCGPNGYVKGRACQNPFFLDDISHPELEHASAQEAACVN